MVSFPVQDEGPRLPSFSEAYFGCLAQDQAGPLRLWASLVLTTTKPCGLLQHIANPLHAATTYENPEKSGQNKSNDAGAVPPETSHCTL